jgi:hypothetical protein
LQEDRQLGLCPVFWRALEADMREHLRAAVANPPKDRVLRFQLGLTYDPDIWQATVAPLSMKKMRAIRDLSADGSWVRPT